MISAVPPATSATEAVGVSSVRGSRRLPLLLAAIAGAWLLAVIAQVTGNASLLHHHALIERGPPLWIALLVFTIAWQVMIAAMMLPASLPAVHAIDARSRVLAHPTARLAQFLASYAMVWTAFGVAAFMGDVVLHHVVDATPWLEARQSLIAAGVVAMAGAYQFTPLKRRGLSACRHPDGLIADSNDEPRAARLGLLHGLDCLASSWALMLVMFAAGFANLGWMAALTVVTVYETSGKHGRNLAAGAGIALLGLASGILASGWSPAF